MNIYDPGNDILYVHMAREMDSYAIPLENGRRCSRLPAGYANRSSRTCLRYRRSQPGKPAAGCTSPPSAGSAASARPTLTAVR